MLPLSLYVHYPFCMSKCPYCDFNSYKKDSFDIKDENYLNALLRDFDSLKDLVLDRPFVSIYFGGGTPSLFSPSLMGKLLDYVSSHISSDTEISMEANPGTVSLKSLCEYRSVGINRLSLGVQSFNDNHLKRLGRIHNAKDAKEACENALKAHFDNLNIDIMHGLPMQSSDEALSDLKIACDIGCSHLSWYELTIEEDTAFGEHPPKLPNEDVLADIESLGFEFLKDRGFNRYEVSGFYKGKKCLHNLNYWYFYDYAGIGAGAHSKFFNEGKTLRRANVADPKDFTCGIKSEIFSVDKEDIPFEFMLNRLRVFNKISKKEFQNTTGLNFSVVEKRLLKAVNMGLLKMDDESYVLTSLGKTMLNDVLELFLD